MTAQTARTYLIAFVRTSVGQDILRALGYAAILDAPDRGDDRSSLLVARRALIEFQRRYPTLA